MLRLFQTRFRISRVGEITGNRIHRHAGDTRRDMTDADAIVEESGRIMVLCQCGKTLKVPKFKQGQKISCPACHQGLSVPILQPQPVTGSNSETTSEPTTDPLIDQVQAEIASMEQSKQRGFGKNLITLLVTLFIFFSLGILRNSPSGILLIILVLFIHEAGHFIGMKLLNYTDVQMFFIPLFGAAVSGKETNPSVWKKALVSLLGPVPGIILGIGTGFLYVATKNALLLDLTRILLFLNTFNLLPVHPLDGGRLVDAILFSRSPRAELAFKITTSALMGLLAFLSKDVVLGIFAFVILSSLRVTYISASVAHRIRKAVGNSGYSFPEQVPHDQIAAILEPLKEKLPPQHHKPKLFATYISGIWQRLRSQPCSGWATGGLLFSYLAFVLLGIASVFLFEGAVYVIEGKRLEQPQAPIEEFATTPTNTFYRINLPADEK